VPAQRPADSTPAPKDVEALRERAERAERERDALRREIERLRREDHRLREELEAAQRAGARQAAPFRRTVARLTRGARVANRTRRVGSPIDDRTHKDPFARLSHSLTLTELPL
jgi:predicted  nucleic acid-binding Zn-ribbon protein